MCPPAHSRLTCQRHLVCQPAKIPLPIENNNPSVKFV